MQKKLFQKLAAIVLLSVLLIVPLILIEAKISEPGARQAGVLSDIAASAAGRQTLVGPLLAIRYRERVRQHALDPATGIPTRREEVRERVRLLPPDALRITGGARVEERSRGIYRARLYHLDLKLEGALALPEGSGIKIDGQLLDAHAFLVLGLSDPRGVGNDPQLRLNGASHRFQPGTDGLLGGKGMHVPLGPIELDGPARFEFSMPLQLMGSERLAIAPAAKATRVSLKSDWPHPSFQGRFLPVERSIDESGFEAHWQVSHLSRSFSGVLAAAKGNAQETLAVSFVDPVNVYLQSERAVKYGLLFVIFTFAAFFVTEILRKLPIHPVQYLLVGLALAVFFLLLVALSEHIAFTAAYAISALACVLLIGSYLAGALGGRGQGTAFGAGIAVLYAVLYGVLQSEDNALLVGAMLIFAALAGTMFATRRLDWYRVGLSAEAAAER